MFWLSCLAEVSLFLESGHTERDRERERERERERRERGREWGGGGGSQRWNRTYQNEPDGTELTAGVNLAFSSNDMHAEETCMQRRDSEALHEGRLERELKCKSEESDEAHRSVPTGCLDPIESKLGFPTCLFLASPLSGPHERRPIASRMEQLSSLFFVAWTRQPLHEKLLMGFRRANGACAPYVMVFQFQWKPFWLATQRVPQNDWTATKNRCELWRTRTGPIASSLKETQTVKKTIFVADRLRGHHPRALMLVKTQNYVISVYRTSCW